MALGDFITTAWNAIPSPFAQASQDLIVLRVALQVTEGRTEAVLDLTSFGKSSASARNWRLTLQDLGLSEAIRPESPPQLVLPLQVAEGLRDGIAAMNPEADRPLWLNLVRPYGSLGMLPWERVLGPLVARPVLRLPDFLERPRENPAVLQCAVVFDPPPRVAVEKARLQIQSIVEGLLEVPSRAKITVHVFTTAAWFDRLGPISADDRVTLHPPQNAAAHARASASQLEQLPLAQLWLDWICAALGGRAIDALHFVGRAVAGDTRTGLLISNSPLPDPDNDTMALALISIAAIGSALTRLGAWAAIFSPPPDESVGRAMAYVADAFARSRPCVVLYHPAGPDDRESVRASLHFLLDPGVAQPPAMSDGFIYCQPAAVVAHADFKDKVLRGVLRQNAALGGRAVAALDRARAGAASIPVIGPIFGSQGPTEAPTWASATQRYIENATFDQLQRNSPDILFTKARPEKIASSKQDMVLKDTLSDIQKIVGSYLKKTDV